MEIRELSLSEIEEAAKLIREVFLNTEARECDEKGIKAFLDSIRTSNFTAMITEGNYELIGLYDDHRLAGVLGARGSYLALLFVREKQMGKGYGKMLFARYEEKICSSEEHYAKITTNSSIGAKSFYEKLGFRSTGEKVQVHGIPIIPMEKDLN